MKLKYFNSVSAEEKPCFDISEDLGGGNFGYIGEVFEEANAAFIVKACNEYENLALLLKRLKVQMDFDIEMNGTTQWPVQLIEDVKEAIKQAEAE